MRCLSQWLRQREWSFSSSAVHARSADLRSSLSASLTELFCARAAARASTARKAGARSWCEAVARCWCEAAPLPLSALVGVLVALMHVADELAWECGRECKSNFSCELGCKFGCEFSCELVEYEGV
eukprot:6189007-Pleurochrysis_carterae.AAC.3